MSGYFADRRRAGALLSHGVMRRASQRAAMQERGAISAQDGAQHVQGVDEVLREAAAAGRAPELTRALLWLVLDIAPGIGARLEHIWTETAAAAYAEVDERCGEIGEETDGDR